MADSDLDILEDIFEKPKKDGAKKLIIKIIVSVFIIFISAMLVINIPVIRKMVFSVKGKAESFSFSQNDSITEIQARLEEKLAKLQKKSIAYTPVEPYFVANMTLNEFWLYKNRELILHGLCSTGSYTQLEAGNDRKWIFKTPRGVLKILGKKTAPVWKKPDWAFIEEGLPVPSANHPSRLEEGVLGDYALTMRDSYMIHGTIYKRHLGSPVTHGCVRLNDEDLEKVYKTMNAGSKVYFY
ncbi:MAG: hypothetical protein A2W90_16440 [Bacteroidetes bacterium GWF2_42_66]|nr:MAG: hypothetical protein A2W92_04175 [Bacteroidetes bacterium GWA2_42_15]OFX96283.1 MAG: hypothetical protein A2W89_05370 [Bacteroidetes bacterium GWE2_42_39]OFY46322.1 MAG: hypothetical protein A2W90_16440 [Bacteroidetes bacterium GWF2_42_66]HAZ03439.1 L,D-transpeptidase [Marinilabiliales bacterium]HBL78295.1 L,D-transpeptidase [Prolixibacteraceae bacterium]